MVDKWSMDPVVALIYVSFVLSFHSATAGSHGVPFADESFRRLQSGENSDEVVNQCCRRESKFSSIGVGLDDTEHRVDVGECRQSCDRPQVSPLRREEFDKYLKKYPHMDPVQIFLALQTRVTSSPPNEDTNDETRRPHPHGHHSRHLESDDPSPMPSTSTSSCFSATCTPKGTRRERHFGLAGFQTFVDVIESCDCVRAPPECQRISRPLRLHVDTPFEKVVDVGACGGPCGDDSSGGQSLSCRPVRNRTVTVEGPNGAECVGVVEECQCTGGCYRVREFLKVFDFTHVFAHGNGTHERQNETVQDPSSDESGDDNEIPQVGVVLGASFLPPISAQPLTKILDLGRCSDSGSCSDGQVTSKCLSLSRSDGDGNATCTSSLYGGQSKCSPTKFLTHSYMDKNGHRHNVISVISCGCP